MSTHHPFINPETGEASQQAAFTYMDRSVAAFYQQLERAGFFKDGVLLVVGDHHAMVPLQAQEIQRSGVVRAPAHVPLIVIDQRRSTQQAAQQQLAQQTDVYHTLIQHVSGQHCQSVWSGVLWGERQRATEQVLFRRGDRRDRLSVLTDGGDYTVQLNGDRSRLAPAGSTHVAAPEQMLRDVHAFRLGQQVTRMPPPKN